jgi:hypothetical protein
MALYCRYTRYLLAMAFIVGVGCSTIKDNMPDCEQRTLTLKVLVADEESDIGRARVDSAQVYLFGSDGYIGKRVIGNLPNTYTFKLDKTNGIAISAWGNLKSDSIEVPPMYTGMTPDQAILKLKKSGEYNHEPPDLFFASYHSDLSAAAAAMKNSSFNVVGDTVILSLKRIVSSVTITAKHISDYFGTDTTGCFFVIRKTKDALNFNGETCGDDAVYKPYAFFDAGQNLQTAPFKILPQADTEYLTVELYHRDEKLFSANTDSNGQLLRASAGKRLNIVMDFSQRNAIVRLIITPWGQTWQDTSM